MIWLLNQTGHSGSCLFICTVISWLHTRHQIMNTSSYRLHDNMNVLPWKGTCYGHGKNKLGRPPPAPPRFLTAEKREQSPAILHLIIQPFVSSLLDTQHVAGPGQTHWSRQVFPVTHASHTQSSFFSALIFGLLSGNPTILSFRTIMPL